MSTLDIDEETAKNAAKSRHVDETYQFQSYMFYRHKMTPFTATGLWIRPFDNSGKLAISIVVHEDTTIDEIKESWWQINKWRAALKEWQGEQESRKDIFYKQLSDANKNSISPNQLAKQTNHYLAELLREYAKYLADYGEALKSFDNEDSDLGVDHGFIDWLNNYESQFGNTRISARWQADTILSYCCPRLSQRDREELLSAALENISKGEEPFLSGEPISQWDIRERIRYWRTKRSKLGKTG